MVSFQGGGYQYGAGDDNPYDEYELSEEEEEEVFDISLAASHSYMGSDLVSISGRSVLEAGWTGKVPVVAHHGAVFPGETVPMLLTNPHDAGMISETIQHDKLFGLLCPDETGNFVSGYGVLCEVFEAGEAEETTRRGRTFKARATHRFRFLEMPKSQQPIHMYIRMRILDVIVLAEVELGEPLRNIRLASLDKWRRDHNVANCRLRKMDALMTSWPLFVYDIFDYRRMKQTIYEYFRPAIKTDLPEEPVSLSFWVASNLALSPRDRLALFMVDDALLRLHMEIRLIGRKSVLCCTSCSTEIANWEDVFAMSSEGVHSNYTNLVGYMHDIVTVTNADNVLTSGSPSAEFSWFPGYTWTVIICRSCMVHLGWRFDAEKRSLRPQRFFGLCRNYMHPEPRSANSRPSAPTPAPPRSMSEELRAARRAFSALVYAPANNRTERTDEDT